MPEIHDQPEPYPHNFDDNTEDISGTAADVDVEADMLCPADYRDSADRSEGYINAREHMPVTSRSVRGVFVNPDGSSEHEPIPDDLLEEIYTAHTTQADAIYAQFAQDREGLDLTRASGFVKDMGITATDRIVVIPTAKQRDLEQALAPIEGQLGMAQAKRGLYASRSDTALIYRDRELERINGTGLTEALTVHELAHSGGLVELRAMTTGDGDVLIGNDRLGYKIPQYDGMELTNTVGDFIEEGVAEYVAGQFVAHELGEPNGFAGLRGAHHLHRSSLGPAAIPLEYTSRGPKGGIIIASAALGARALGHFIDRDPALLPALIAGARDDEAFTEVRGRMNAIIPGSFEHLQDNYNSDARYEEGLLYVCNRLGIPLHRLH